MRVLLLLISLTACGPVAETTTPDALKSLDSPKESARFDGLHFWLGQAQRQTSLFYAGWARCSRKAPTPRPNCDALHRARQVAAIQALPTR